MGLLLITAAFCLVGYNLWESYRAGEASEEILAELEQKIDSSGQDSASAEASGADSDNPTSEENGDSTDVSDSEEKKKNKSDGGSGSSDQQAHASEGQGGSGSGSGTDNGTGVYDPSVTGETTLGDIYPDREMPNVSVNQIGYIGYIFIPSLSLRLPVQSSWVYDLLTISPARYSGSVYQNNMIIGGHSYITHFRALRGIAPGSRVIFYDTEGYSYEYEVSYVMSLNPNQGAILYDEEDEDWDLTLFTCNTGGQTRCIVRCVRTE